MFYLDESRERRWKDQVYTDSERRTYIREQHELFRLNQVEGRTKSVVYKKVSVPLPNEMYKF